jgi:hypothetical protein
MTHRRRAMARRSEAPVWQRPLTWAMSVAIVVSMILGAATRTPDPSLAALQSSASNVPGTASVAALGSNSPEDLVPSATAPGLTDTPPVSPTPSVDPPPSQPPAAGRFGLGLLIADRGNGRLVIVNDSKRILWQFPAHGSLPNGQRFSADDAFIAPDGRTIVANDEAHQVIDRIDIASRKVTWQYGHYDTLGAGTGYLHTPDDAYPLANGDIVVADIRNCRILEVNAAKQVVRHWGQTGSCNHAPPTSFDNPNGDTPLPDGGLLITEIGGSRIVRLGPTGNVVFDIHVPVSYPSDAQLDTTGDVLVVDYSKPGAILRVSPEGRVLWRYGPKSGPGSLDHPSLAIMLADGTIALNDDFRSRVVVVDPRTNRIVWQYGRTDAGGRSAGTLLVPDGIDPIPVGTSLN